MPAPIRFGVDAKGLKQLSADIRAADRTLGPKFNRKLRDGAQIVADEAKANASWSTRIPQTIKVRAGAKGASVVAGGTQAPNAAPLEHGGVPGEVRHPVFGDTNAWVSQPARPFLFPALTAKADAVAEKVAEGIDDFVRDCGFR